MNGRQVQYGWVPYCDPKSREANPVTVDVPVSLSSPSPPRRGRKARGTSVWSVTHQDGDFASTAATSVSKQTLRSARRRSSRTHRNAINDRRTSWPVHVSSIWDENPAVSRGDEGFLANAQNHEVEESLVDTAQMPEENDCRQTDAEESPASAEQISISRLHALCDGQRASLDSVLAFLRPYNHDFSTQIHLNNLAEELRARIDTLEITAASMVAPLRTTFSIFPTDLYGSDVESEEIPPILQEYYDAAGWAGVIHERLVDHQHEHAKATAQRRRDPKLSSLFETESEKEFSREEHELKDQLRDARRKALDILKQCKDQGIQSKYPPRSSLWHSVTSSAPKAASSRGVSPLGDLSPTPNGFSHQARRYPTDGHDSDRVDFTVEDLWNAGKQKAQDVHQWLANTWKSRTGAYNPYQNDLAVDGISTTSVVSLPEYIRVETPPPNMGRVDVHSDDRTLDLDHAQRLLPSQKRMEKGIRKTQSFSSVSSPSNALPSTNLRRQTHPEARYVWQERGC